MAVIKVHGLLVHVYVTHVSEKGLLSASLFNRTRNRLHPSNDEIQNYVYISFLTFSTYKN